MFKLFGVQINFVHEGQPHDMIRVCPSPTNQSVPATHEHRGVVRDFICNMNSKLLVILSLCLSTHYKKHLYSRSRGLLYHVPAYALLLSLCITPEYPRDFTDCIMQCFHQLTNNTTPCFARYVCVHSYSNPFQSIRLIKITL